MPSITRRLVFGAVDHHAMGIQFAASISVSLILLETAGLLNECRRC